MLKLTRKPGERVFLFLPDGIEIVITLADVDRNKVVLGFDCDRDIKIWREELLPLRATDTHEPPGVEP